MTPTVDDDTNDDGVVAVWLILGMTVRKAMVEVAWQRTCLSVPANGIVIVGTYAPEVVAVHVVVVPV